MDSLLSSSDALSSFRRVQRLYAGLNCSFVVTIIGCVDRLAAAGRADGPAKLGGVLPSGKNNCGQIGVAIKRGTPPKPRHLSAGNDALLLPAEFLVGSSGSLYIYYAHQVPRALIGTTSSETNWTSPMLYQEVLLASPRTSPERS